VSQKYYKKSNLEKIREDIGFYFKEWLENEFNPRKTRQHEIRYRFSIMKFYEIMFKDLKRKDYKNAEQKYDDLFPISDTFSMNRKT
jgi:hypothetical protein